MRINISVGEFFDRLTILEIKAEKVKDKKKLKHVLEELGKLAVLTTELDIELLNKVGPLVVQLKITNERLWIVEDQLREKEALGEFNQFFTEEARSVYKLNDLRFKLKQQINEVFGCSENLEEKSYRGV